MPRALRSHCLQMQATDPEGDVGKAVRACTIEHYELLAIEVRAQAGK
jgi:hypothetical protein